MVGKGNIERDTYSLLASSSAPSYRSRAINVMNINVIAAILNDNCSWYWLNDFHDYNDNHDDGYHYHRHHPLQLSSACTKARLPRTAAPKKKFILKCQDSLIYSISSFPLINVWQQSKFCWKTEIVSHSQNFNGSSLVRFPNKLADRIDFFSSQTKTQCMRSSTWFQQYPNAFLPWLLIIQLRPNLIIHWTSWSTMWVRPFRRWPCEWELIDMKDDPGLLETLIR